MCGALCSTGEVPPGGIQPLIFRFCPLEAKVYEFSIPIRLEDGSQEVLKIEGRGYHVDNVNLPEPLRGENSRVGNFTGHDLQGVRSVMESSPLTISEEIMWFEDVSVKARSGPCVCCEA